jgi:hypothetical protein
MNDQPLRTVDESTAMRAALIHLMLLDDYIGVVLSRAEACEPGFLRESLIEYVGTLQRERLTYYRIGLQRTRDGDDAAEQDASFEKAA